MTHTAAKRAGAVREGVAYIAIDVMNPTCTVLMPIPQLMDRTHGATYLLEILQA